MNSNGSIHSEDSSSDSSVLRRMRRGPRRTYGSSTGPGRRVPQASRAPRTEGSSVLVIDASSFERRSLPSNGRLYDPTAGRQDEPTNLGRAGNVRRQGHCDSSSDASQSRSQNLEQTGATGVVRSALSARSDFARAGVGSLPSSQIESQPSGIATLPPKPEISFNFEEFPPRGSVISTPQPPAPTGSAVGVPAQTPSLDESLASLRARQEQIIQAAQREAEAEQEQITSLKELQAETIRELESQDVTDMPEATPSLENAPFPNGATTLSLNRPGMPATGRPFQGACHASPSQGLRDNSPSQWSCQRNWQNAPNSPMYWASGPASSSSRWDQHPAGPYSTRNASQADEAAADFPSAASRGLARRPTATKPQVSF